MILDRMINHLFKLFVSNSLFVGLSLFAICSFIDSSSAQEKGQETELKNQPIEIEVDNKEKKSKRQKKNQKELQVDTVDVITNPNRYRPRRAAFLSAIVPGAGQIYNKSAWKVPIIYGGFATFVALAVRADQQYKFWLVPFLANNDAIETTEKPYLYTLENSELPAFDNVVNRKNTFRRNRDLYYILIVAWYALNIVEAGVDAHLQVFNVDENLSVSLEPSSVPNDFNIPAIGLGLTIKF